MLQNPDKMTIQITRVAEPFVNCNVNGGDSGGYYFVLTNPHYMYNFKGEPVWEIEKADPDFYRSIFEIFADKIDTDTKKKPIVLRDFFTDTYYNGVYDETKQQFDDDYPLTPTGKVLLMIFLSLMVALPWILFQTLVSYLILAVTKVLTWRPFHTQ